MHKVIKFILGIFLFFIGYAHTIFPLSTPVIGRLAIGETFAIIALLLFFLTLNRSSKIVVPKLFKALAITILTFSAGLFVTQNLLSTVTELLILLYLGLISLLIVNYYRKQPETIIILISYATIFAAIIGIWDLVATFTSLPSLVSVTNSAGRLPAGTFRNSGQAGAFMQAALILLIPAYMSSFKAKFSKRQILFIKITTLLAFVDLVMNMKVAAIIGISISAVCYLLYTRSFKILTSFGILIFVVLNIIIGLKDIQNPIVKRFYYKYNTRIAMFLNDDSETQQTSGPNFMDDNYGAAIKVFKEQPLTGSGYGGFAGIYHSHEVHSTPLKIIGESGILGIIGYLVFMAIFLRDAFGSFNEKNDNHFTDYRRHMSILLIGAFVSWGYTFHFRKRFFWTMVAVISVMKLNRQETRLNTQTVVNA